MRAFTADAGRDAADARPRPNSRLISRPK
jgi:hypothetical protein